ncbi:MAG: hypothetical protein K9G48_13995 [Reyranella sp.]|nr:hypothetical protein [Reyranella sp.]
MDTAMTPLPATPAAPIPPELEPISWMCTGPVRYFQEGERRYIYMQGLHFLVGDKAVEMDALLAINWPNPTYPTRLFFPEPLGHGLNWHESAFILGKSWITWSWTGVQAGQTPAEILANHLVALQ